MFLKYLKLSEHWSDLVEKYYTKVQPIFCDTGKGIKKISRFFFCACAPLVSSLTWRIHFLLNYSWRWKQLFLELSSWYHLNLCLIIYCILCKWTVGLAVRFAGKTSIYLRWLILIIVKAPNVVHAAWKSEIFCNSLQKNMNFEHCFKRWRKHAGSQRSSEFWLYNVFTKIWNSFFHSFISLGWKWSAK